MPTRRDKSVTTRRGRPASTPDQREAQMVGLAVDLAEKQLRDGTASAQVTALYLKMGSSRERLELQKLERENDLLKAKVEMLASSSRMEELYEKAIGAMTIYSGEARPDEGDYEE